MRGNLDKARKREIGALVDAILDRNLSRTRIGKEVGLIDCNARLAEAIGCDVKTIFRMKSGDFSMRTLRLVGEALGTDLENEGASVNPDNGASDVPAYRTTEVRLGGYSYEQIEPYLGTYQSIRRGAEVENTFLGTQVVLSWDEERGFAVFDETNHFVTSDGRDYDYSQDGTVHMSSQIGMLHLLTSNGGALRLVTLTRMAAVEEVMFGAILTQVPVGASYVPAKTTVVLRKVEGAVAAGDLGLINEAHPNYEAYRDELDRADTIVLTR